MGLIKSSLSSFHQIDSPSPVQSHQTDVIEIDITPRPPFTVPCALAFSLRAFVSRHQAREVEEIRDSMSERDHEKRRDNTVPSALTSCHQFWTQESKLEETERRRKGQENRPEKKRGEPRPRPVNLWNVFEWLQKNRGLSNANMGLDWNMGVKIICEKDIKEFQEQRRQKAVCKQQQRMSRDARMTSEEVAVHEEEDLLNLHPPTAGPSGRQGGKGKRMRILRESYRRDETSLQGFSKWILVPFRESTAYYNQVKKKIPEEHGVYEWAIKTTLFGGETKFVAFYVGRAIAGMEEKGLRKRFRKYVGAGEYVGPRDNGRSNHKLKEFVNLQREHGLLLYYRFKEADDGKSAETMEKDLLQEFDYAFNRDLNRNYRFKFYEEAKMRRP